MENYNLKRWQVIDLLKRMLVKYKKKLTLSELEDEHKFVFYIARYCREKESEKFAKEAFGTKRQIEEKTNATSEGLNEQPVGGSGASNKKITNFPKILVEFGRFVRTNKQHLVLSENQLNLVLKYLVDQASIDGYELVQTPENEPRLAMFQGTRWYLYYGEGEINGEFSICRVILDMYSLGEMTIHNITVKSGKPIERSHYRGQFYIGAEKYLFIEGRVQNKRELRIIFDLGANTTAYAPGDLLVGYYVNGSTRRIASGPIILEKIGFIANRYEDLPPEPLYFPNSNRALDLSGNVIAGEKVNASIWHVLREGYKFIMPTLPDQVQSRLRPDTLFDIFNNG